MQKLVQKNREIIEQIELAVRSFRKQNYFDGNLQIKKVYKPFEEVLETIIVNKDIFNQEEEIVNEDDWQAVITETMQAQEREDYVLLADLLEINWLQRLHKIQMCLIMMLTDGTGIVADCENGNKKYIVEYTTVGSYTLKVCEGDKEFYMHSNNSPFSEGMFFAEQYLSTEANDYIVFGMGLGYHIKALVQAAPEADITVFESDEAVMRLADEFGAVDLSKPEYRNVHISEDYNYSKLREALVKIDSNTDFLVHIPSLNNVSNQSVREKIEEYFMNINSSKNQRKYLDYNFKNNISRDDENADVLKSKFEGKTALLVARGPSLNDDIAGIKRIRDEVIVVAVYSVADLLIKNDIIPDYIVMSDAQTKIGNEVKNSKISEIPLIYVSTAASNIVASHKGKKYILYQEGYDKAVDVAEQENHTLFSTGGSVSTVIVDMCIRFGCDRLICVGLDLALTGGNTHAAGTRGNMHVNEDSGLRTVMDVNGKPVSTRKNLDIYRKWIERRIEGVDGIEFINASSGAFIKGMKHQKIGRIGNILVYYGASSYKSILTFAQELVNAWEDMGYNVVAVNARDKEAERNLLNAGQNKYDFIFSMNGILANTTYEDGRFVQNSFDAPFIAYMVDHPLYMADRINSKLNNFHTLLIDENHVDYVKKYYPNVTSVGMLPHGGIGVEESQIVPYAERKIDVIFSGSYENPDDILTEVKNLPQVAQVIVMNIIEQMINDHSITVEKGLDNFLKNGNISLTDNEYKSYMELTAYADRYVRALYRNLVVMALVKNGIRIYVFGSGWNKFKCDEAGHIIAGGSIDPARCTELMAHSKIVLNVMPWVKNGSHERVFNAMMNGAVCLTDPSEYLEKEFTDDENIAFYSISDLTGLVKRVKHLLNNDEEAEKIAMNGYKIAREKHTWKCRAKEIASLANQITGKEDIL